MSTTLYLTGSSEAFLSWTSTAFIQDLYFSSFFCFLLQFAVEMYPICGNVSPLAGATLFNFFLFIFLNTYPFRFARFIIIFLRHE